MNSKIFGSHLESTFKEISLKVEALEYKSLEYSPSLRFMLILLEQQILINETDSWENQYLSLEKTLFLDMNYEVES